MSSRKHFRITFSTSLNLAQGPSFDRNGGGNIHTHGNATLVKGKFHCNSSISYQRNQGRRISNLGGHDTSRALFLKRKGAFSKNEKGTSLFIAKSWGAHAPSAPPPGYYVYERKVCAIAKLTANMTLFGTKARNYSVINKYRYMKSYNFCQSFNFLLCK